MGLNGLTKDLAQALASDLAERQHDETVDVVKIAGVVGGLAAAAVTVSKYSFDPQSTHAVAEASAGATVGVVAATWKNISNGFCWIGKHLCACPGKAKHAFILYYFAETSKQWGMAAVKPFRNEKTFIFCASNDDCRQHERMENKRSGGGMIEPKF
ncbi:MAG: hypothetical protein AB7E52_00235 [Bdellovibrionales bacterium]